MHRYLLCLSYAAYRFAIFGFVVIYQLASPSMQEAACFVFIRTHLLQPKYKKTEASCCQEASVSQLFKLTSWLHPLVIEGRAVYVNLISRDN